MTILDPVAVANLAVFLVQLPRGRTTSRKASAPLPIEFVCLEQARAAGEVVISETGMTERVRLENHSAHDLFIQAGEVLRGGNQDRAAAGDLIIPAPLGHPEHEFAVQALITQRAMEALHVSVLPGAGWFDVEGLDVPCGQPALQGAGHELAAVVAANVTGHPSLGNQLFHDLDEVGGGELAGDVEREALTGVLIDDREDAQLASIRPLS